MAIARFLASPKRHFIAKNQKAAAENSGGFLI
jgi:hypothetical protein